jgi:hypothetical protein
VSVCAFCGAELPTGRRMRSASAIVAGVPADKSGRRRRFCDDACRKKAWRRRQAGLDEDAYPTNGRRGRVPLAERTRAEWRAYYQQVILELEAAKAELERTREVRS